MRKKIFFLVLLMFLLSPCAFAQEQTITVTGKGDARVIPDIVYLFVGIETIAKTPGEAVKQNSVSVENLKKKIVSFNIKLEDVKTANFYLYKKTDYVEGKEVFRGYSVTNTLEVPVEDIGKAGDILDGLMAEGVNSIQNVEYSIKDRKSVEKEVLNKAVSDARAKAEDVAKNAGYKLGKVISIKESYSSLAYYGAEGGAGEGYAGPFVPGKLKVAGTAEVTYKLTE